MNKHKHKHKHKQKAIPPPAEEEPEENPYQQLIERDEKPVRKQKEMN